MWFVGSRWKQSAALSQSVVSQARRSYQFDLKNLSPAWLLLLVSTFTPLMETLAHLCFVLFLLLFFPTLASCAASSSCSFTRHLNYDLMKDVHMRVTGALVSETLRSSWQRATGGRRKMIGSRVDECRSIQVNYSPPCGRDLQLKSRKVKEN